MSAMVTGANTIDSDLGAAPTYASEARRKAALDILCIAVSLWLLSYYLLPNTLFGRISPGGLIMELAGPYPAWIMAVGGIVLCTAIAPALRPGSSFDLRSNALPIWLLTLIYSAPLLTSCFVSRHSIPNEESTLSIISAIAIGVFAVRLARSETRLLALISLTGVVQSIYAMIYQHEHINALISGTLPRAGGTFDDPNNLYVLMMIALPFGLAGAVRAERSFAQFGYLAATSLIFAALVTTWSRGAVFGAGAALVAFCYGITRSKRLSAIVFACMSILCATTQAVRTHSSVDAASTSRSNISRINIWHEGWTAFAGHPLLGIGIESFAVPDITKAGGETSVRRLDDPKNIVLDWLVERGIGGGLLIVLFAWTIYASVGRSPLSIATGAAWAGLLAAGLFDTPMGSPERYVGNCCFGILLGATALLPGTRNEDLANGA